MHAAILERLQACRRAGPASKDAIRNLPRAVGRAIPNEYLELLAFANGIEGHVGDAGYLVLYSSERMIMEHECGLVSKYLPQLLVFGSDGGDAGYAYDSRTIPPCIVQVSLSCPHETPIHALGPSLVEFLGYVCAKSHDVR
jgi:hypothetical protein